MASFAEELAKLSNPVPSQDPEDDIHEYTRARLVDKVLVDNDSNFVSNISKIRKLHNDDDPKYKGEIMSRKHFEKSTSHLGNDGSSDISIESDNQSEEDNDDAADDDYDGNEKSSDEDLYEQGASDYDEDIDSDVAFGSSDVDEDKFAPLMFKGGKSAQPTPASKERDTKNQIKLWEAMLVIRIKLQKIISLANQLPQPSTYPMFAQKGGKEFKQACKKTSVSSSNLHSALLELQLMILKQNPDSSLSLNGLTNGTVDQADNESIGNLFGIIRSYRNKTLTYWYDKTRLSSGNVTNKSFTNFERPTVAQIEHVLSDRTRLIERTQLRRSKYRVLGSSNNEEIKETEAGHDAHLKQTDGEIFDDDDFYQQLLRQLIEQKSSVLTNTTDSIEMTRQWLKLQRFQAKTKKVVDTKASKGRKIRYHVHPKLVSFMTPEDRSLWTHESRNQLVKSVFGQPVSMETVTDNNHFTT